jgi:hypothetical protein
MTVSFIHLEREGINLKNLGKLANYCCTGKASALEYKTEIHSQKDGHSNGNYPKSKEGKFQGNSPLDGQPVEVMKVSEDAECRQ